MSIQREEFTPFYKEPFAWLLLVFPFAAVLWGIVMLSVSFKTQDSLVSDSYYKDGVSYTENQALDHRAVELQIQAQLQFDSQQVTLGLSGQLAEEPESLQLKLIHPTLENEDVTLFLQRIGPGQYASPLEQANLGKRSVWLISPTQHWRLRTQALIQAGLELNVSAQ